MSTKRAMITLVSSPLTASDILAWSVMVQMVAPCNLMGITESA